MTPGQMWVKRRIKDLIRDVEDATSLINVEDHKDFKEYSNEVYDLALDIIGHKTDIDFESDSFWDIYDSIMSSMEDIFNDQLKDYYGNSEETLNENFDQILDLYKKVKEGEKLKPSEQSMMRSFKNFVDKGGNAEEFVYDLDQEMMPDEREGERFRWERHGTPLTYEFSEEYESDGEINYFGEIKYMGDEFLGVISTDKRGYLTDYDFYSVFDEEVRLQDILKENGLEPEITNFFQEEIINSLRK
jgi:hypothetical protein